VKKIWKFFWSNFELFFWVGALIALFFLEPVGEHFSLCPLKNMGIEHCPGCGLGHSVHYALHFQFNRAIMQHPLGLLAIVLLFSRIYQLIKNIFKTNYYEYKPVTTHSGR